MKAYCGLARLLAMVSAMAAFAIIGGATTSDAATSFNITLAPLIGTSDVNVIPQVSYGGKIGYHLPIDNNGDSKTQHPSILVPGNLGRFSDRSKTKERAVDPKDAHHRGATPSGG